MATTTTLAHTMAASLSPFGRAGGHDPRPADYLIRATMSSVTTTAKMITTTPLTSEDMDVKILSQQQVMASKSSLFSTDLWTYYDGGALFHALLASFSVILVSELGDKTFIITAIMAMKNSRLLVFLSSALALFLMTVLSVGMGVAVTVIPKLYTHYASIVLFLCFGIKMLKEAYDMKQESDESEFEEVKRSLEEENMQDQDISMKPSTDRLEVTPENTIVDKSDNLIKPIAAESHENKTNAPETTFLKRFTKTLYIAPIVIKVFAMVFVAEWGDRSQISTIILAAREDVIGVFVGSLTGHVLCTGLAVIGGRFVAEMISVRTSK